MQIERHHGSEDDLIQQYFTEVRKKHLLTTDEEIELGKRKDSGDFEARNALVEANLRFVANIAKKYIPYTYTGSGLSYLDLIQAGNEALIESVNTYDHTTGYKVI